MSPSLRQLRREVDALQRRVNQVLAILRMRKLAMEFCDECDEAGIRGKPDWPEAFMHRTRKFMPRVGQAGFDLDTFGALNRYFHRCVERRKPPEPREIVFTLLPWARRGPRLRPSLWERPAAA